MKKMNTRHRVFPCTVPVSVVFPFTAYRISNFNLPKKVELLCLNYDSRQRERERERDFHQSLFSLTILVMCTFEKVFENVSLFYKLKFHFFY